jgi:hypothetical protein
MRPHDDGPRRKAARQARKGVPTGRRATHPVITTYGRGQARRDHLARWAAATREQETSPS